MAQYDSRSAAASRWWDDQHQGNKPRADACTKWLQRVLQRHELRRRVCLLNSHMYEDIETMGLGPYQYAIYDLGSARLRMNLVRAVVDSYVSQVSRSKPKPRALTSDGDWSLKKKAEGLTRWGEGKADELRLYEDTSQPCCRDSAVWGLGLAKVFRLWPGVESQMDVGVERTFPWELVADDAEAQNPRNLRNLAHIKYYDRSQAAEMFPDSADWILHHAPSSSPVRTGMDTAINTTADLVPISELWHLPCYPGADDGLHVICVDGRTLYEGPWTRMRFPFARLYRSQPTLGIWGVSIPHELRGRQVFINQTMLDIEDALRLWGKPKLIYKRGSMENAMWSDEIDEAIEFDGEIPPQVVTPSVMPPETYQFLLQQWQGGFEQIGLSQQAAQAQLPQGLSGSGASIRAWDDVQNGRMYEASVNYENWHMEIFDLMIDEAREIAKVRRDYATAYRGKTAVQVVNFREVDPGKDKYYLHVYPESRLSKNPAQRLAQLQELFNAKLLSNDEFRELLDFPDLEGEDMLMNSPRRLAEMLATRFLDAEDPNAADVFLVPEPDWPLQQLKVRMGFAKLRARVDNAPDGNLRLFDDFLELVDELLAKQAANSQLAPAPNLTGAPQAAPGVAQPMQGMAGPPVPPVPPVPVPRAA